MPKGVYTRKQSGARKPRKILFPIGPSIVYVQLTQGKFACIDIWDAERVGKYNWCASWHENTSDFRAKRRVPTYESESGKVFLQPLHVFILGNKEGFTVDHKEPGNALDCRRANLRHADHSEQQFNQGIKSNNTSGYKGVCWNKAYRKYQVEIRVRGERIHLGYTDTAYEGHLLYCEGAKKHHGEFGRTS